MQHTARIPYAFFIDSLGRKCYKKGSLIERWATSQVGIDLKKNEFPFTFFLTVKKKGGIKEA